MGPYTPPPYFIFFNEDDKIYITKLNFDRGPIFCLNDHLLSSKEFLNIKRNDNNKKTADPYLTNVSLMNIPGVPKVLRHFLFRVYLDFRKWLSLGFVSKDAL